MKLFIIILLIVILYFSSIKIYKVYYKKNINKLVNKNIILDKESESTFQNALVISKWIKKNNLGKVTIITSYYHMPRTMLLLKTLSPESEFFVHPVKKNSIKENLFKDNMYYYLFLTEEFIKYLLSHLIIIV